MPVKDKIVNWFIQNIIIPKREIIDNPGFVITTFTDKNVATYLRDLILPEQLFELIESGIIEEYGKDGSQALYSTGKKFGYLYSSLSTFPTINDCSKKDFLDFAYFLVRYMEVTFARQAEHEIILDEKTFTISFKDYVICRHNGFGHIMSEGGITGIWAYLMQDKYIDGVQLECEGRGDNRCYVLCAPEKKLLEKTDRFFCEKNLQEHKFDDIYRTMNEIRQTKYSHNSLKNLLDIGFFEYDEGFFSFQNLRFFGCESHILYILEQEISKLKDGEQILFNICFEYGKKLQEVYGETDYQKFIMDFFPAIGFGDIVVMNSNNLSITASYYPWTIFSENSKYIIFRGIMSGFVSSALGNKIEFNKVDIDISNCLTLTISK
jgi:hypothetical protein